MSWIAAAAALFAWIIVALLLVNVVSSGLDRRVPLTESMLVLCWTAAFFGVILLAS